MGPDLLVDSLASMAIASSLTAGFLPDSVSVTAVVDGALKVDVIFDEMVSYSLPSVPFSVVGNNQEITSSYTLQFIFCKSSAFNILF